MDKIPPEIDNYTKRYPAEVILFIGAGASANFDMPLMNAFFSKYFPGFSAKTFRGFNPKKPIKGDDVILYCIQKMEEAQIRNILESGQSSIAVDLEKLIEYMVDVKRHLIRPDNPKVLTALNLAITTKYADLNPETDPNGFYCPDLWREFVSEIDNSLNNLTRKLYEIYGRKPDEELTRRIEVTYKPLFDLIADHVRGGIAVFTTNYDSCLDLFLKRNCYKYDRPFSHGFKASEAGGNKVWHPRNYETKTDGPVISYFNLHGSVLWKKTEDGWEYTEPENGRAEITNDGEVALEAPVIGKGTSGICKTMYDFYAASLANSNPRYFITIGYSFRDDRIPEITSAHFKRNTDIKFVHISPSDDYRKLITQDQQLAKRFLWINKKFGTPEGFKAIDEMTNKLRVWR